MPNIVNIRAKQAYDPDSRYDEVNVPEEDPKEHPLDSPENLKLLRKLQDWYAEAQSHSEENRYEMHTDESYYDGDQWTEEEVLELVERNQAPIVLNHIKPAVDWVIGTERRTRQQIKVIPRKDTPEQHQAALAKSQLLKYLDSSNSAKYARSNAFAEAVKAGVGWLEDAYRGDVNDDILFSGWESWRNVLLDPFSTRYDIRDARYLFRLRWLDLDYLQALFPDRAQAIRLAAENQEQLFGDPGDDWWLARQYTRMDAGGDYVTTRQGGSSEAGSNLGWERNRVFVKECWYREIENIDLVRGNYEVGESHPLHNAIYREDDEEMTKAVNGGVVSLQQSKATVMKVGIFVNDTFLLAESSPYRHNDFPFTPIWAYRRAADRQPYGVIRNARDPQDDMNKRASKSIFLLSANQIIADERAADDWDDVADNASDPRGILKVKGDRRFELVKNTDLAAAHINLMDRDQQMIRNASGVQGENLGMDTSAISGKAVKAKQDEGAVVTFELFDNIAYSMQLQGSKRVSLIEQYFSEPKTLRHAGERGQTLFYQVNEPEVDPTTGEVRFLNDVTAHKSDFALSLEDHTATTRQAMAEQLMDMVGQLGPEVALQILDIAIEMTDLPGKDELARRIRKINNQEPPIGQESPEEEQERATRAAEQEKMKKMEVAKLAAEFKERIARSSKTNVEAQQLALQVGQQLAFAPEGATAADEVLASAGFQDHGEIEEAMGEGQPPAQTMPQDSAVPLPTKPEEVPPNG